MDPQTSGVLINGRVLTPGQSGPVAANLVWQDGHITAVGPPGSTPVDAALEAGDLPVIDAAGALVLPGIVDVHGDAFERCVMPRGGVPVNIDTALADNDLQLLAAGITTSYLSATDSWEPGLRSRETLRALVAGLARRKGGPDVLLHVRHERCNTEDLEELIGWIEDGTVSMFSYNDHTNGRPTKTQLQRTGLTVEELQTLAENAVGRREEGRQQEQRLATITASAGCVTASHDASTEDHLSRDLGLGVGIAEFPLSIPLAKQYQAEGVPVLLGAPNLVRGGSHLGNLSVRDALVAEAGDLLCSDYHYPSLFQAAFVAEAEGLRTFGDSWDLVSGGPARAAGLTDRGRLEPGARADVIVVASPVDDGPARVEVAVVAGRRALTTR